MAEKTHNIWLLVKDFGAPTEIELDGNSTSWLLAQVTEEEANSIYEKAKVLFEKTGLISSHKELHD